MRLFLVYHQMLRPCSHRATAFPFPFPFPPHRLISFTHHPPSPSPFVQRLARHPIRSIIQRPHPLPQTPPPTSSSARLTFTSSARRQRPSSSTPDPTPHPQLPPSPPPALSLSQRLRKLSREYGWSAVGVYLAFSALDFPFCFIAVRALGTDRIGEWEHRIVGWVKRAVPINWPGKVNVVGEEEDMSPNTGAAIDGATTNGGEEVVTAGAGAVAGYDHGVKEAEMANKGESASIWTQLALAYAIHKSFIFIRVPLTAAVTPKVVKVLRGWGWNIGKRKAKLPSGASSAGK